MDKILDIKAIQKEVLDELGAKKEQEVVEAEDDIDELTEEDNVLEENNEDENGVLEDEEPQDDEADGDEEIIPVRPIKQEKQDYAFKELREKNKTLESKISALDEIAQRYGFGTHDDMLKTLEEDSIKKEAQQQNIDPKFYKELKETQKKLDRLENEKKEEVKQVKLQSFLKDLDSFSKDFNLNDSEKQNIIEKMDNDGYTIDMLLGIKNPRVIFKGYVEDKIVQKTEQRLIEKTAKKKTLEEKPYSSTPTTKPVQDLDALADWAIKKFRT
jgi:hypothetical protein